MKTGYTIKERFNLTLGNIEYQGGAHWDDIEKLEHLLALLKLGKKLTDEFDFVKNHKQIISE
jgi:hypothetical protein